MQKRWALSVPLDSHTLPELAGIAQEAESLGYTDAWSGETDAIDAFTPLVLVALNTKMRVGTAIADAYSRGPQRLASTAASMSEVAAGRFVLGIGASSVVIVQSWNSVTFEKPVTRVREMATVLRQALAGERVVFDGETIRVNGIRLSRPPIQPVPIHIAALRPNMLRVAGTFGDGAILNFLSAEDTKKSVAVVREAAAAAGKDPGSIEISARIFVSLDERGEDDDIVLRRWTTSYLNVPTYKKFQQWLGRESLTPMWRAWDAGDRKGALSAIGQDVLDELYIRGTPEERRAHLRRYFDCGIDTAFFHFMTNETDIEKRRAKIRQGIHDMAPR
ncbi:MAG: LLM class F420-dependent oxidoreductase [Dehalococcoidia bacterium]